MRWILLVAAIVGLAIAFTTTSPALMGLGLILGCGGLLCFGLALAAARIARTAQPETALIVDPEISALRAKANQTKSAGAVPRKPAPAAEPGSSDRDA
ncbi:MAG: hypothetical protein QM741_05125 [Rudaea sp.]|uniref:hypothetical protein n=1 Tax=Rudaea sp. TaxID=2136325 RepID=UPI0039E44932